jgi:hypothetical protein
MAIWRTEIKQLRSSVACASCGLVKRGLWQTHSAGDLLGWEKLDVGRAVNGNIGFLKEVQPGERLSAKSHAHHLRFVDDKAIECN